MFQVVEEDDEVRFRRESISSVELVIVINNSIIMLIGKIDLQLIICSTLPSIDIWRASYIMDHSSSNMGLLKYNLLINVVVGNWRVVHTFFFRRFNVLLYGMRKSFVFWHWNSTQCSDSMIWPFKNKVAR